MYISVDGKLLKEDKHIISQNELGFNYGYGLFETIKLENTQLIFFNEHIDRLSKSCIYLKIDFNLQIEEIYSQIINLIKENRISNGLIKIIYTKEKRLIISTGSHTYTSDKYKLGYKLCFAESFKNPHSKLTFIKSMNYLENIMAKNQARENGFDEALFLNIYGYLTEGSFTNVFFVKNDIVYTPDLSCGLLEGIMRGKVLHLLSSLNIDHVCGSFFKKDILDAEEVFITNSLMEIMPVCRLEQREFSLESNIITKLIIKEFKKVSYS